MQGAGKVIVFVSLLLWVLASFGPGHKISETLTGNAPPPALEQSYAGVLGKALEPAIRPLGFDWKIGIALVTSFAAREVFVGTMATLYSVEESDNSSLRDKLKAAVRPDGTKVYSFAAALSLMIFYVLAMQCMSTLAVVKRETQSWKWPTIQFFMMTGLAYFMSWAVYVLAK